MRHVVVHQFDPGRHLAGGIAAMIRDFVRYAPDDEEVALVGVSEPGSELPLGRWTTAQVAGREIPFMPVARLALGGGGRRRVPHTVLLAAGLVRYRPRLDGAVLHSHRTDVAAALALLYPRNRRVVFVQTDEAEAQRHGVETFWRFVPRAYARLERSVARRARRTVVMSSKAVARLRPHADGVVLGAHWYDPALFHARGRAEDGLFTVAWVGRFEPAKHPLRAVDALARLRDRGVPFRAWLAGAGSLDREVREAVARHGLEDVCELPGLLGPAEIGERLRRTHALLMTSRWEGFPRASVEALASGVPIVATAVGELPNIVSDGVTGYIAASGTAEELAELLERARGLERGSRVAATVAAYDVTRAVPQEYAAIAEATAAR